jgi:uncharacterized protein YjbI with pentapeptide repeats
MSNSNQALSGNSNTQSVPLTPEPELDLDKIVEDSSERNRNFFTAYLGLLIYVLAIVLSTTDKQLLLSTEGLNMPIIDLTVPLVGFYMVVPILVIALHFNFMQNLESHHHKLMCWQAKAPGGKIARVRIQAFIFDYAVLEKEGQMRRLVIWVNSFLCFNLAPIALGLLLIRFSDIQNPLITIWHFVAFIIDVWLVWILRLGIEDNKRNQTEKTKASLWLFLRDIPRQGMRGVLGGILLFETFLTISMGWTTDDYFVENVQPLVEPVAKFESTLKNWLPSKDSRINEAFFRSTIQHWRIPASEIVNVPVNWFLPRIAVDPAEVVWKPDKDALEVEAKLAGYNDDYEKYFKEKGRGFLPVPKTLRLASLVGQNLPKAQFKGIKLQGAKLVEAQLQGADLWLAQLQGADLREAKLQGADLNGVQLQGANLSDAQLQGANLVKAQLQEADLSEAKLQGANLHNARLQGAILGSAQLQGANLDWALLQGAYLRQTQLQGANLHNARLLGAYLRQAQLQGADLSWVDLQGADLVLADLQGADLRLADLKGALIYKTGIVGVLKITSELLAVFNLGEQDAMFDESAPKWEALETQAKEIQNTDMRDEYLKRIKFAKEHPSVDAKKWWVHNPAAIADQALPGVCKDRLESTSAFRSSINNAYSNFKGIRYKGIVQTPEYPVLIKDIDTKLCTLEECKEVRDKIKDLDCKTQK